jgi:hypothetical protein
MGKREITGTEKSAQPISRLSRYASKAGIQINGFDGQALISNININGFCMTSKTYVEISPGQTYTMQIIPEPEAQLATIEMQVEVRWTRVTETDFKAGFKIVSSNHALQSYLTYLERT